MIVRLPVLQSFLSQLPFASGRLHHYFLRHVVPLVAVSLLGTTSAYAGALTLAWDAPAEGEATGYVLWFGTSKGTYSAHIDVGPVLTHKIEGLADGTTYCFAVQAYNDAGEMSPYSSEICAKTPGTAPPPPTDPPPTDPPPTDPPPTEPPPPPSGGTPAAEVVLYASKATVIKGDWVSASSAGAAGGRAMRSTDRGWSAPNAALASPAHYFETTFTAAANTPYTIWLRLRAGANSKWNDSVWVQFSDSLAAGKTAYRIGTTSALLVNLERCNGCAISGWGWHNNAYWVAQNTMVTFAQAGSHTIRVQTREDGVEIDQIVVSPLKYIVSPPGPIANDTTILTENTGTGGSTPPPTDPPPTDPPPTDPPPTTPPPGAINEIVVHAIDASGIKGNWAKVSSVGAAGGKAVRSADQGWSSPNAPLASPGNAFDVRFNATANTAYQVWLRLRATGNSKLNDAVWVQFSDSLVNGQAAYRLGSTSALLVNLEGCDNCGTSGWGWHNTAYWLAQNTVITFAESGTKTMRVQIREDGVEIDQVVLSAVKYRTTPPGPIKNDATILAKTAATLPSKPFTGVPVALPGNIDAAHFDQGTAGVAYGDSTPGNLGNVFRGTDVDLEASSLGGYNIAWTGAGEWVTYTVNVKAAGTYTAEFRVASVGGATMTITAGAPSKDTRNVAVPKTGGTQKWTTVKVPITLAAGQQVLTVRFVTGSANLRSIYVR